MVKRKAVHNVRHPALEAAIFNDPDDEQARLVYADWLTSEGDPRGELAMVQSEYLRTDSYRLMRRERDLLKANRMHWLGDWTWLEKKRNTDYDKHPRLEWWCGFIDTLRLEATGQHDFVDLLARILRHPSARFVRHIHLRCGVTERVDEIGQLLARHGRCVRVLTYQSLDEEPLLMGPLWAALVHLRHLNVDGTVNFGPTTGEQLERLTLQGSGFDESVVAPLMAGTWPRLRRLDVRMGSKEQDRFHRVLRAGRLAALRHLTIQMWGDASSVSEVLKSVGKLDQLVRLELCPYNMVKEHAEAIIARADLIDRIEEICMMQVLGTDNRPPLPDRMLMEKFRKIRWVATIPEDEWD